MYKIISKTIIKKHFNLISNLLFIYSIILIVSNDKKYIVLQKEFYKNDSTNISIDSYLTFNVDEYNLFLTVLKSFLKELTLIKTVNSSKRRTILLSLSNKANIKEEKIDKFINHFNSTTREILFTSEEIFKKIEKCTNITFT